MALHHGFRPTRNARYVLPDPFFNQTVLLLNGNGTNGAQNNTFIDSSPNNFTLTRNGNTTQGTFSPFSQPDGRWSNFFDGSGDYLTLSDNAAFTLGSGDFTVEFWFYNGTTGSRQFIAGQSDNGGFQTSISFYIEKTAANKLLGAVCQSSTAYTATSSADAPLNQWVHFAFVRNGNTGTLYVNGTADGTVNLTGVTVNDSSNAISIGRLGQLNSLYFNGYISNFRQVVGTAVYTGNFTPPTFPLTAISGTSLLTCQDNRFIDKSSNNFAITRNGDVRVTPFSPFATTTAYSPSVNGGSGYFDGDGSGTTNTDSLSIADNTALSPEGQNFTMEAWVYLTVAPTVDVRILDKDQPTTNNREYLFMIRGTGNFLAFEWSTTGSTGTSLNSSSAVPINAWTHVAVTRNSNSLTLWINGVSSGSTTISGSIFNGADTLLIGNRSEDTRAFPGYISNVRIVKGTTVYTSNFTPPTAPLTAITNTSLLLNFTNAGIIDNTGKNVLETVGDAKIDTTVKKYGTGALKFDDSGDYLIIPASPDTIFGTGAFTIECWAYPTSFSVDRRIISKGTTASSANWLLTFLTTGVVSFAYNNTTNIQSSALSLNTWYHIAVVGNGSTITLYIDGVSVSSVSYSYNYSENSIIQVSRGRSTTSTQSFDGYIDDLRITKGIAVYTANFTPPTQQLPDR